MQRTVPLLFAIVVATSPLAADDVHLTNGQVFENVEADVGPERVRIGLGHGSLTLARSQVLRVVEGDSYAALYRSRLAALEGDPEATADDWLDLARWCRSEGFHHGYREAVLRAAELEPRHPALGPVMGALGFRWDERLERWIPVSRVSESTDPGGAAAAAPSGNASLQAALVEALERRDSQIDRALDALAAAAVRQPEAALTSSTRGTVLAAGVGFYPPLAFAPAPPPGPPPGPSRPPETAPAPRFPESATWSLLARRQPGSLIPASPLYYPH